MSAVIIIGLTVAVVALLFALKQLNATIKQYEKTIIKKGRKNGAK